MADTVMTEAIVDTERLVVDKVRIQYRHPVTGLPFTAVAEASLSVAAGEIVSVVGPSGCGKSTLLGAIGGLVPFTAGSITLNGQEVTRAGAGSAVVFQKPALLPWRTALRNVAYPLRLQGVRKKEALDRARAALDRVGLGNFAEHYPEQLSGGMQQRVNLARALATQPELLLMDEPFGALDALTKEVLQDELLDIVQKRTSTTIFITHDIEEAVFLGDRVVVMSARPGRIAHIQELPFGRPRRRTLMKSPEFTGIVSELREMLRHEPTTAGSREGVTAL
jgi:NitT/TauT family transport system ATP-binding protein